MQGMESDALGKSIFRYLGHDFSCGHMQFCCPSCGTVIHADPLEVLGDGVITGFPHKQYNALDTAGEFPVLKKIFSLLSHH